LKEDEDYQKDIGIQYRYELKPVIRNDENEDDIIVRELELDKEYMLDDCHYRKCSYFLNFHANAGNHSFYPSSDEEKDECGDHWAYCDSL